MLTSRLACHQMAELRGTYSLVCKHTGMQATHKQLEKGSRHHMRCVAEGAEPTQKISICRRQQQYCCGGSTAHRRGWRCSSMCLRARSYFDNYSNTLDTAGMPVHQVAGIGSSGALRTPRAAEVCAAPGWHCRCDIRHQWIHRANLLP